MLEVRITLAIILLFCIISVLFIFIFSIRPLKKIINLAIAYNAIIFLMTYIVFIHGKEEILGNFLIIAFIGFLLNIIISVGIINNILKCK